MSGKLSGQVWALDLPRNERDVLLAMADHADDFGRGARPSIAYIAWKVGISAREVIRCLKWLRDPSRKIIEVTAEAGFHKPTCYRIFVDRAPQKQEFVPKGDNYSPHSFDEIGDGRSPIEREKGDNLPAKGDREREKGDNLPAKGDRIVSPEPLLNRFNEPLAEPLIDSQEKNPSTVGYYDAKAICLNALNELALNGNEPACISLFAKFPNLELWKRARDAIITRRKLPHETTSFKNFAMTVEALNARSERGP